MPLSFLLIHVLAATLLVTSATSTQDAKAPSSECDVVTPPSSSPGTELTFCTSTPQHGDFVADPEVRTRNGTTHMVFTSVFAATPGPGVDSHIYFATWDSDKQWWCDFQQVTYDDRLGPGLVRSETASFTFSEDKDGSGGVFIQVRVPGRARGCSFATNKGLFCTLFCTRTD